MDINTRLSALITDTNALAEHLGCTAQAISQFKLGKSYPKVENLIKIADYYDVSLDYLVGIVDVRNRNTDLQSVCDYTGLSEASIHALHTMCSDGNRQALKFLDYLIAYDYKQDT